MKTIVAVALLGFTPLVLSVSAEETASMASLQSELQALRAQNAALQRENAELKAKLADNKPVANTGRQEDQPQNRLRLPANVTINHNPR